MAQSTGKTLINNSSSDVNSVNSNNQQVLSPVSKAKKRVATVGSRRNFSVLFKIKVLDAYRNDPNCRLNQRATARTHQIHRRQIQKWLQCEEILRKCAKNSKNDSIIMTNNEPTLSSRMKNNIKKKKQLAMNKSSVKNSIVPSQPVPALNLNHARLHGDELTSRQGPPPNHVIPHPQCGISPTSTQCIQHSSSPITNDIQINHFWGACSEYPRHSSYYYRQQQENNNCKLTNTYETLHTISDICKRRVYNDYHNIDRSCTSRSSINSTNSMSTTSTSNLYHPHPQQQPQPQPQPQPTPVITSSYLTNTRFNNQEDLENSYLGVLTPRSSLSSHVSYCHQQDKASPGNDLVIPAIKTERASPNSQAITGLCNNYAPISHMRRRRIMAMKSLDDDTYIPKIHKAMNKTFENVDKVYIKNELPEMLMPNNQMKNNNENKRIKVDVNYQPDDDDNNNNNNNNITTSDVETRGTSSPLKDYNYSASPSPRETASISSISSATCYCDKDPLDYSSTNDSDCMKEKPRRRSYSLRFKNDVLDAFYNDMEVVNNQRATAKKYGIDRRQVQKWLSQQLELRGGVLLRGGDMRQRLSACQEITVPFESPVDLRTPSDNQSDNEHDNKTSSINFGYDSSSENITCYQQVDIDNEISSKVCNLSCCSGRDTFPTISYYPESQKSYYIDSQSSYYYYPQNTQQDNLSSTCNSNYCCDEIPSRKRQCTEWLDDATQETPLCLVKPKRLYSPTPSTSSTTPSSLSSPDEPVSITVPTILPEPAKKDDILFRPYLDEPISKPTNNSSRQGVIVNGHNINNNNINDNNNNNYYHVNDKRNYIDTNEVNYRLPVSWRTSYIPDGVCSAFTRYPVNPHNQ